MLFAEKSQISHTRGGGGGGKGGSLADRDKMIVSKVLFINKELVGCLFVTSTILLYSRDAASSVCPGRF